MKERGPFFQKCMECGWDDAPHVSLDYVCARCESFAMWCIVTGRDRHFWSVQMEGATEEECADTLQLIHRDLAESRRIRDAYDSRALNRKKASR